MCGGSQRDVQFAAATQQAAALAEAAAESLDQRRAQVAHEARQAVAAHRGDGAGLAYCASDGDGLHGREAELHLGGAGGAGARRGQRERRPLRELQRLRAGRHLWPGQLAEDGGGAPPLAHLGEGELAHISCGRVGRLVLYGEVSTG